jgi:rare lipoprotein A
MNRIRLIALSCAALCVVPVAALASSGGTEYVDPAPAATDAVLLGHVMHVTGTLAAAAGQTIVLERRAADGPWVQAATTVAAADGTFDAAWKTDQTGHFDLRARPASASAEPAAAAATALPSSSVTVFRRTLATWFGPGFYGHRTACGQVLSHRLLGVANRTLPCGTKVALLYQGRTITVPVVDRGPFAHGADYDLTAATAQALGVTTTSRIGVVRASG